MPVGNEGAGVVVKAGASDAAQALVGKTVAMIGGGMYAQYRCLKAADCLVLPPGTTPTEGASWFVNPLTSLGMVETMRREGHKALVHTAAASNLGQMLNKICLRTGSASLTSSATRNRKRTSASYRRKACVQFRCADVYGGPDQGSQPKLGATLAFDAIGGGKLASQILTCMEAAASKTAKVYSRYGSTVHKQVYISYGVLILARSN